MLRDTVGENINKKRVAKGLTIEKLAACAGLDTAHVGRIARGRHNATLSTVRRLATALSAQLHELFNEGEQEDDYTVIEAFVKNSFPAMDCSHAVQMFDQIGHIFLDKITVQDVENSALPASEVHFKILPCDERHSHFYGISAIYDYPAGRVVETVEDVTADLHALTAFTALLSAQHVAHCHFFEVVQDFLATQDA